MYPTTDMYTTTARSITQTLMAAITAAAGTAYPVFNELIDKKKLPDQHAAISVSKVTDAEDFSMGGGQSAFLDSRAANVITRQTWPDSYDLMYQIECMADNINDLRALENIVISAFRPRARMFLWDSNAVPPAFTTEWIEYRYAGYINRDIPADNIYNRIRNIHFYARNVQPAPTVTLPAIQSIMVDEQLDGADADTISLP